MTIYPQNYTVVAQVISTPLFSKNLFVRWSTVAVKDDFTQKAVVFDSNTFGMFQTNTP